MRYLPICAKYGQLPYYLAWVALPYTAMAMGYVFFSLAYLLSYFFAGPYLEHEVSSLLKRKGMGLTRGMRFLHGAQIASVLVAALLGLSAQMLAQAYMHPDLVPMAKNEGMAPATDLE